MKVKIGVEKLTLSKVFRTLRGENRRKRYMSKLTTVNKKMNVQTEKNKLFFYSYCKRFHYN